MYFTSRDITGATLPAAFLSALWREDCLPTVRIYIDFSGTGVDVEVPAGDLVSFSMNDKIEGTNGLACSNTLSIELNNYNHRFSSHCFNDVYDPAAGKFNGPPMADGRGNLRPGRRIKVQYTLQGFEQHVVALFEGNVSGGGFKEVVSGGNKNSVRIEALDYAKFLIDKEPKGDKVWYGGVGSGQFVEKEVAFENCKICDPNDVANSLVHRFVAFADPSGTKITVSGQAILIVINHITLSKNIWSELAELADATHSIVTLVGNVLYFGDSELLKDPVAPPVESQEFNNVHYSQVSAEDDVERIKNDLMLTFSSYKELGKCPIWMINGSNEWGMTDPAVKIKVRDIENPEDIDPLVDPGVLFKANYSVFVNTPITAGGMIQIPPPPAPGGVKVLAKVAENYKVVSARDISYQYLDAVGEKTLKEFDILTLKTAAIIKSFDHSGGTLDYFYVRRLMITGIPTVEYKENKSFIINDDSIAKYGKKFAEYTNKYITCNPITFGSRTVSHDRAWLEVMLKYVCVPRNNYTFNIAAPLLSAKSGTLVRLRELLQGSLINVIARIDSTSISYNAASSRWNVSFKASEEVVIPLTQSYYTGMPDAPVIPSAGGRRDMTYDPTVPLSAYVPYSIGDTILWSDGLLYRAVVARVVPEPFSIADFVPITEAPLPHLIMSVNSIARNRAGILSPASITAMAKTVMDGEFSGYFEFYCSPNGSDFIKMDESLTAEFSRVYNPPVTIVIETVSYLTFMVKILLYTSIEKTKIADTKIVQINLDVGTVGLYFGALLIPPPPPIIEGDYYWDDRDLAAGGGFIKVYNGSTWENVSSSAADWPNLISKAMTDIMTWASKNPTATGDYIVAASAVFNSIVASNVFVTNLFAKDIVASGSIEGLRIRSYQGSGVQRRATQLDNDSLDWIDAPDGGDEQLRARIGRIGVGGAVLMDGDINISVVASWTSPVTVVAVACTFPNLIETSSGTKRIAYLKANSYLYEKIWNGTSWGTETLVNGSASGKPYYIELSTGELRISYYNIGNTSLVERTWGGSSWGSASPVVLYGTGQFYLLGGDGVLRIFYVVSTFLYTKTWNGSSWDNEVLLNNFATNYPAGLITNDGSIRLAYTKSDTFLYEKVWNGVSWNESLVTNAYSGYPSYIQDCLGVIRILYQKVVGGNYLVEKIWNGTSWGAEISVRAATSYNPSCYQFKNGDLSVVYTVASILYCEQITLQRYAKIGTGAGIIESGSNASGSYIKYSDGTMECRGRVTLPSTYSGSRHAVGFPASFMAGGTSSSITIIATLSHAQGSGGYATIEDASIGSTAFIAACWSPPESSNLMYVAIGRWK